MAWQETTVAVAIVLVLGALLGVAIPGCMAKQREAQLKCIESRPSVSVNDCRTIQ